MTALDIEKEKRDFEAWVRADIGMPSALPFNWEAEWVKTALPVWLAAKRANAEVVKVLQRALNAALDQPSSTTPAVTGEAGGDGLADAQYQEILRPVLSRLGMRRYLNGDPIELNPSDYRSIIDRAVKAAGQGGAE